MDQQLTDHFEKLSINDDTKDKEIEELKIIGEKVEKLSIKQNKTEIEEQEIIQKQDNQTKQVQKKEEKANEEHIIIKGTQRPDGTYRKDTKIRAGYKNPEMIARYVIPQKRKQ